MTDQETAKASKMEIERNVEDDPWETGLEKVENVYCPMKWIPEIESEGYKLRFFDDQGFVERMGEELYYLETVRELFDDAKNHEAKIRMFEKFDDGKKSAIMTITGELSRRAEGCCYLAEEIASGRYSLDVHLYTVEDDHVRSNLQADYLEAKNIQSLWTTRAEQTQIWHNKT